MPSWKQANKETIDTPPTRRAQRAGVVAPLVISD
jgi:hypothetical protein